MRKAGSSGMYLPELAKVDARFVHEPWKMTPDEQRAAGVVIGKDYPAPIVDHATGAQTNAGNLRGGEETVNRLRYRARRR